MVKNIFSFLKRESVLRCDWCCKEMASARYTKSVGSKKYSFCSQSCKKQFRNSGKGKQARGCPSCKLRR